MFLIYNSFGQVYKPGSVFDDHLSRHSIAAMLMRPTSRGLTGRQRRRPRSVRTVVLDAGMLYGAFGRGVLRITLPRKESSKPRRIVVQPE